MSGQSQRVSALNSLIAQAIKSIKGERGELRFFNLQVLLSSAVIAIALAILLLAGSRHLGANPLQQSALALAGFVYGLIGTPHVLAFLVKATDVSRRMWIRVFCSFLAIILLNGSTLAGVTWMAFDLPSGTPWHVRAVLVIGSVALVVAGWREAIASPPQPKTHG